MIFGEIIAIIAEAYAKYEDMEKEDNFKDWQDQVGQKLHQILEHSIEILRQLRDFRMQIEINLDERFRTMYLANLQASINSILSILAGLKTDPKIDEDRLKANIDILKINLFQSLTYGFATVPLALTGYTILQQAMKFAGIPKGEIEDTHQRMCDAVFRPALDIKRVGSFAWTEDEMSRSSIGYRQQVVDSLRSMTIGYEIFPLQMLSTRFFGDPDNPDTISNIEIVTTSGGNVPHPPPDYALPLVPSGDVLARVVTIRQMLIDWAKQSITNKQRATQLSAFNDLLKKVGCTP